VHLPVSQGIFRPADHPINIGAIFDGNGLVKNIAFNLCACIEVDVQATNWPHHPAADEDFLGHQFTLDKTVHVDNAGFCPHRAKHRAVNMKFAGGCDIALDGHVLGNN